jgi:hypothetical protein
LSRPNAADDARLQVFGRDFSAAEKLLQQQDADRQRGEGCDRVKPADER